MLTGPSYGLSHDAQIYRTGDIMIRGTDQSYLLNEQYKTSSNLTNRASLHERFSTNPQGWMHWMFDQYDLPENASVLELGCGPAWLWRKNTVYITKDPGMFVAKKSQRV